MPPGSDPLRQSVEVTSLRQRLEVYRMLRRWKLPRWKAAYSAARASEVYIRAAEARR